MFSRFFAGCNFYDDERRQQVLDCFDDDDELLRRRSIDRFGDVGLTTVAAGAAKSSPW